MWDVTELTPPADLLDAGFAELPDVLPDWVLLEGPVPDAPRCDCCGGLRHDLDGSLDGGAGDGGLPAPSSVVLAVAAAVAAVEAVDPTALPPAQALVDAQLLLQLEQRLRVHDLKRLADVGTRGLNDLAGYRSSKSWLRGQRPDGDGRDADLAIALRGLEQLSDAVHRQAVPLLSAHKVARALRRCGPHLDARDGLIDGQPGEQVIEAVLRHVVTLVCRDLQGLHDDDPRLLALLQRAQELTEQGGSQAARLEAAFTWLAEELSPRFLAGPLDELVMSILPRELEDRGDRGHKRRGLDLRPLPDGAGWHLCGDLDLECGERLWAALRSEAGRDPQNPTDTEAWEEQRQAGTDDDVWGIGLGTLPRSRRQHLHDAMSRLLERYLDAGLGGFSGKAPVQIHVTVPESGSHALPARADSGQLIPRGLVRRWWCDSSVTAYVLSLGGKALRVVHGQRTLTAEERRALAVEGGGHCAGEGCCPSTPDPLVVLRPHHTLGFAEDKVTTIEETLAVCDTLHHDLHDGKRTVRLRDGRYLDENGFRDAPDVEDHPPF